ncbi:hypothetical protein F4777DRAFT_571727 [Nemania sp. FL0916]|nr:hypothetical protein F4777DRAFT_571727 [Nemania sp. FL0916]
MRRILVLSLFASLGQAGSFSSPIRTILQACLTLSCPECCSYHYLGFTMTSSLSGLPLYWPQSCRGTCRADALSLEVVGLKVSSDT